MSSINIEALLSNIHSAQIDALIRFDHHLSHTPNHSIEQAFSSLLEIIACFNPDPQLREAIISIPHFPQSALSRCLKDPHPNVRSAVIHHPDTTTSTILHHLVHETNQLVIIACLKALHNLSDEQALEALAIKHSSPFSPYEFYAVLRQCAEHHSLSVRAASAQPIARLLQSPASEAAFTILEHLLCDVARVACATIHAMLDISHKFKLSDRVVRALLSLNDAGQISALRLLCNVPCKTISSYAFLDFYMERKVYNASSEERQKINDFFTGIVLRNENFARVLDFSRDYPDKQWFWRGEKHDS